MNRGSLRLSPTITNKDAGIPTSSVSPRVAGARSGRVALNPETGEGAATTPEKSATEEGGIKELLAAGGMQLQSISHNKGEGEPAPVDGGCKGGS